MTPPTMTLRRLRRLGRSVKAIAVVHHGYELLERWDGATIDALACQVDPTLRLALEDLRQDARHELDCARVQEELTS